MMLGLISSGGTELDEVKMEANSSSNGEVGTNDIIITKVSEEAGGTSSAADVNSSSSNEDESNS